jgi:hypothetical protein
MWDVRGRGMVHTGIWWGNPRERDHLQDLDVDGRIILKRVFNRWVGAVDSIDLLRVGKIMASFNTVMDLGKKCMEVLTSCGTVSFSKRTASVISLLVV